MIALSMLTIKNQKLLFVTKDKNFLYYLTGDNYIVLSPGKCHFTLFGVKEKGQFDLIYDGVTLKHNSHKKFLGVTIDNKLSFDEHIINICKTANKKLITLGRVNYDMKQN